jgi:Kef-type K+ transport system membrane component KefB
MNTLLIIGILISSGLVLGEIVDRLGLPRITGYILAGILLNPTVFHFVPAAFVLATTPVTNIALAILTFAVGGILALAPLRELGKGIAFIVLGEAEFAAILVVVGTCATLPFLIHLEGATFVATYLPLALLLGALASPTDPSATLAVIHQYKAKGPVSFSIMAAAALDDALGIMNFSLAAMLAAVFTSHATVHASSLLTPLLGIAGAILLGMTLGVAFHFLSQYLYKAPEGLFIVLILAILTLCYGLATLFHLDQLLATMTVGIAVVNFGRERDRIFRLIENYAEPLVFVLFFTISGMLLDFQILLKFFPIVLLFVVFRSAGKLSGAYAGAALAHSTRTVRRLTGWGLIPQGGIVIGLALVMRQNPAFDPISDILLNVIIGSTVIHELIGPLTAKFALQKAGELAKPPESTRGP